MAGSCFSWILKFLVVVLLVFCRPSDSRKLQADLSTAAGSSNKQQRPLVPAIFIFGDSLADTGNNNFLATRSRADHPPYGMSYPERIPTGRFSDGYLVCDLIAQKLGLDSPPNYQNADETDWSKGANFASASSGVFSYVHDGNATPLPTQVDAFSDALSALGDQIGDDEARKLASRSIFYISTANNDMLYYRNRRGGFPQDSILEVYTHQIRRLHDFGAQKFVIVGAAAGGCVPITQTVDGGCDAELQSVSASYNQGLDEALENLRSELGLEIVRTKFFELMMDVMNKAADHGLTNTAQGCCPRGEASLSCTVRSQHCDNPAEFMFFDGVHTAQAFNKIV